MHKYVGDKETRVYHINLPLKDECKLAMDIDVARMVQFDTREEAQEAGYRPCNLCVLKTSD